MRTQLSMSMSYIERMNYGYARDIIKQVLDRVREYDLADNKGSTGQEAHQ